MWFIQWNPLDLSAQCIHTNQSLSCERCCKCESLTIGFQCERCWRAQNLRIRHSVLHQTDVTSYVRGLNLRDVQVPCVLGDEAPTVLSNKWGELIKYPAVDDLYKSKWRTYKLEKCRTYLCVYSDWWHYLAPGTKHSASAIASFQPKQLSFSRQTPTLFK